MGVTPHPEASLRPNPRSASGGHLFCHSRAGWNDSRIRGLGSASQFCRFSTPLPPLLLRRIFDLGGRVRKWGVPQNPRQNFALHPLDTCLTQAAMSQPIDQRLSFTFFATDSFIPSTDLNSSTVARLIPATEPNLLIRARFLLVPTPAIPSREEAKVRWRCTFR